MASTWKTVRIFISSTFRDMHAERDHLVKVVFPALREKLEKHRIYLIDIDLRWGVTREQAENDQALDLCLQQIDECRPFFIGILGERYGWVPTRYPADAVKKFGWIQQHTGKSVTELEILHGVLQNPQMRGRAFFYFRDPLAIQQAPEAIYAETERAQIEKLADLKMKIRHSGHPVMDNYPAQWAPEAYDRPTRSQGRLVGLEAFGGRVRDQLWQAIQEDFQLPQQPSVVAAADLLAEEQDFHERFMDSRLRVYVGREIINDALLAFAAGNDLVPCLVTGPSGSGKSAALARFVRDCQHKQPQTLVIPHFIGASPRSTNLRDMLRRFCQVFKARFGFAEDVPEETAKLSVTFREFVAKVPADARVLLVIDALNQLDEADRAQELYWLPTELPPQVKVIVSCISDSGKTEPVLEASRRRKHHPVELAALSAAEQREIIRQVPSLSAKTLDDDQVRLLLSNPATANPLFLLVALEELRGFAPYERLNERIAAFPREGDSVTAVFTQVIERLEDEFDREVVQTVLSLLASARRGLSERELLELIQNSSAANLQSAICNLKSEDLFPVLRQLRPYLLSRAGLIDFYHRNLFKAVHERYLPSADQQRQAHVRLADYFHTQDYWLESLEEQQRRAKTLPPTPRPANVRKVDELPWQLLQAADWQRCEQLLTDLPFLEAKAEAGMVFDLAADFSAAIGGMTADRPLLRILRLLEEALRRDIHFIARHPTTVFQCMWNSCWWYDCAEAAGHYELVRVSLIGNAERPPWQSTEPKLSTLLEFWRIEKGKNPPGFPWLRSQRPPRVRLGSAQQAVFSGHDGPVHSVAVSPDGRRIASGSADKMVRIWDTASGVELLCLRGHEHMVHSVAYAPDGRCLVSGSEDQTLRVWDAATGAELLSLKATNVSSPVGYVCAVSSVVFSSDSGRVASGHQDGALRIWDARTGAERWCIPGRDLFSNKGHDTKVTSVAFSPDGCRLASASMDMTARVWDVEKNEEVYCVRHKHHVCSVAFSPDGQLLATAGYDSLVHLWDAMSGVLILSLNGHHGPVTGVAFSSDGRQLLSGSWDQSVRLWDTAKGDQLQNFEGHEQYVEAVAFLPQDARMVSGGRDGTVRMWTATNAHRECRLWGHTLPVVSVAFSPDGQMLASASWHKEIGIWNAVTGTTLFSLPGHEEMARSLSFSPDGTRLASASRDRTVKVWDLDKRIEQMCVGTPFYGRGKPGHEFGVESVAFSPDGRQLASGSIDRTVRIWDAFTGTELHCLMGHEDEVHTVAFSPDGRWVVSGSKDKSARVWDAVTGAELLCLRGHDDSVTDAAFSPDCSHVVTADEGAVRIWDASTGCCLETQPGKADVTAIAGGPIRYPFQTRVLGHETAIGLAGGGNDVAWSPGRLARLQAVRGDRTWAGGLSEYVSIITLEGAPHIPKGEPPKPQENAKAPPPADSVRRQFPVSRSDSGKWWTLTVLHVLTFLLCWAVAQIGSIGWSVVATLALSPVMLAFVLTYLFSCDDGNLATSQAPRWLNFLLWGAPAVWGWLLYSLGDTGLGMPITGTVLFLGVYGFARVNERDLWN